AAGAGTAARPYGAAIADERTDDTQARAPSRGAARSGASGTSGLHRPGGRPRGADLAPAPATGAERHAPHANLGGDPHGFLLLLRLGRAVTARAGALPADACRRPATHAQHQPPACGGPDGTPGPVTIRPSLRDLERPRRGGVRPGR